MDYDLDDQDRQWLAAFNRGQERLPHRRMELLLWRLDTANAEATDTAFLSKSECQVVRKAAVCTCKVQLLGVLAIADLCSMQTHIHWRNS